jgi:hypothetical protein
MAMAEKIRLLDSKVNTIILTSDDARYLEQRHEYTASGRWRFVINSADTAKGTGTLSELKGKNHSAEEIFMSMFTSLHLQVGKLGMLAHKASIKGQNTQDNPLLSYPLPSPFPLNPIPYFLFINSFCSSRENTTS